MEVQVLAAILNRRRRLLGRDLVRQPLDRELQGLLPRLQAWLAAYPDGQV